MDALAGREIYLELEARGHLDKTYLRGLMREWLNSSEEDVARVKARRLAQESDHMMAHYCDLLRIGDSNDDMRKRKADMKREHMAEKRRKTKAKKEDEEKVRGTL
jgi:hypothetical protein